jgi:hypothetical protein
MVTAELAGSFEAPIYGMLAVRDAIAKEDWGPGQKPEIILHGQPDGDSKPILPWDDEWQVIFRSGGRRPQRNFTPKLPPSRDDREENPEHHNQDFASTHPAGRRVAHLHFNMLRRIKFVPGDPVSFLSLLMAFLSPE